MKKITTWFDYNDNPFNLTDEQRFYPFKTKAEKDAAVDDTLNIILPIFGGNGKKLFGILGYIADFNQVKNLIESVYDNVRNYLENMLGQVITEINKENLMEAAGKAAAEEMGRKLLERYGISFPITNLASDTIAEELGEWFADLVNIQLSKKLGYEVEPFSTLFPMENIVPEFDAFVTEGVNNALGTDIQSVFDFPQLKTQIESAVFTRLTDLVNERFMLVKSDIMQAIAAEIDGLELPEETKPIISAIITDKLNDLALNLNTVLPTGIKAKKFYFSPTAKLYNKLRQQKYRKTHRQQSVWVLKDQPATAQ